MFAHHMHRTPDDTMIRIRVEYSAELNNLTGPAMCQVAGARGKAVLPPANDHRRQPSKPPEHAQPAPSYH